MPRNLLGEVLTDDRPAIPQLEPAVLREVGASPVDRTAPEQWEGWWRQLFEGGGFWPEHLDPNDFV
jgi:hypothetical protein